jgi:glutamate-1-semialdehyde 2,1-aminomutase
MVGQAMPEPTAEPLADRALRVIPSGIAHDVRFRRPHGPYFRSGAGAHKTDVDGRRYVDYVQGHGSLLHGHAPPFVVEAVARRVAEGTHLGGNHPGEVRWAELLRDLVPSVERVRFTASGTEATLLALRLARTATGRDTVIKLEGHFHGWHDYVVAGLERPYDRPSSPGIPAGVVGSVEVVPHDQAAARIARGDVAALILEPNGATWGTRRISSDLLGELVAACRAAGAVSIFDEVISGFRAAPGGIQQLTGLTPDLTTMAKVMAGGLPGGAVGGRSELMEPLELRGDDPEWNRWRHVHHPGTYNGNPLSAAAGIAVLERLTEDGACDRATATAARLRRLLTERLADCALPVAVWGDASWFHVGPGLEAEPQDVMDFKGLPAPLYRGLDRALLDRGIDTMTLGGFVSAAHDDEDVDRTVEAYGEAMDEVARATSTAKGA